MILNDLERSWIILKNLEESLWDIFKGGKRIATAKNLLKNLWQSLANRWSNAKESFSILKKTWKSLKRFIRLWKTKNWLVFNTCRSKNGGVAAATERPRATTRAKRHLVANCPGQRRRHRRPPPPCCHHHRNWDRWRWMDLTLEKASWRHRWRHRRVLQAPTNRTATTFPLEKVSTPKSQLEIRTRNVFLSSSSSFAFCCFVSWLQFRQRTQRDLDWFETTSWAPL